MRVLLPALSLLMPAFSILVDVVHPPSDSALCALGLCRFDQLFASIDSRGIEAPNMAALVNEDPSNPFVWCTYGEFFASHGQLGKAQTAFERAVTLGPGMAPVLMRAANFDFAHGRTEHGLQMAKRILILTSEFDEVLFSYFLHSHVAAGELLAKAIPNDARPARAWLEWAAANGLQGDLPAIWTWMILNHLLDPKTTTDVAQTLWQFRAIELAQQLWIDWLGARRGDYPDRQLLWNPDFNNELSGSPFDWTSSGSTADVVTGNGLEIYFSDANDDLDVHQFTTVSKGRFVFSAEISANGLTVDPPPRFHIFDPANPQVDVRTQPIRGTLRRFWVNLEFQVPPNTKVLEVQLERHAGAVDIRRMRGILHVYQTSLVPAGFSKER